MTSSYSLLYLGCIWDLQELEGLSSREVREMRLLVTQEGELDALAVWFQLHLDEENSLSTGPQEDTCWEQAIYPVHSTKSKMLTHRLETCMHTIGLLLIQSLGLSTIVKVYVHGIFCCH